jgi:molecular chaperone DnaK
VESGLQALKDALAGTDLEAIKTATEQLVSSSQQFAQRLYDQASASQGPAASANDGGASAPNDDEVVDAEIVDGEAS